jgi:ketosteroid isomerase-like protein
MHTDQEETMSAKVNGVTGAAIKRAIEGRDGRMLSSFYADDAIVRVVDRNNPPSRPREVRGKQAITTFWDDICSRAMTHEVAFSVAEGERLAFSQACAYPDGAKVFCLAMVELKGGKIAHQTLVQAWDE